MELTIKSKILAKTLTFSRPGSGYIYVDINGQNGTLGLQICAGGGHMGSTIEYTGDDQEQFNSICRNWYRSMIRDQ